MVLRARLELARLTALAPKTSAATNYATSAKIWKIFNNFEFIGLERECLARQFSEIYFLKDFVL